MDKKSNKVDLSSWNNGLVWDQRNNNLSVFGSIYKKPTYTTGSYMFIFLYIIIETVINLGELSNN